MEPEADKPTYQYPLAGEEVVLLQSDAHLIAARYTKCEATRSDYAQIGLMKLLTKKVESQVPPKRVIQRAIERHIERERQRRHRTLTEVGVGRQIQSLHNPTGDPLTYAELREFVGLGLAYEDSQIAKLFWHQNRTLVQIAEELGTNEKAVLAAVKRVRQAVKERWLN